MSHVVGKLKNERVLIQGLGMIVDVYIKKYWSKWWSVGMPASGIIVFPFFPLKIGVIFHSFKNSLIKVAKSRSSVVILINLNNRPLYQTVSKAYWTSLVAINTVLFCNLFIAVIARVIAWWVLRFCLKPNWRSEYKLLNSMKHCSLIAIIFFIKFQCDFQ